MEFFERKEEVFDIQLTEFGKVKLAEGKFKPTFYAFFDDDVVYDIAHGGTSEVPNSIQDRIFETARLKLQTNMGGINTNINQSKEQQSDGDKFHFLTSPLGTAETGNNNAPAWSVRFFNENLVRVIQRPTGSYYAFNTIPQLNATVEYQTFIDEQKNNNLVDMFVFQDDTYINIVEDSLFIRVLEHNTNFNQENFEIEVFEVETQTENTNDTKELLKKLEFSPNVDDVNNTDLVQYFLEINVDAGIDSDEFCKKVPMDERTLYWIDRIHDCNQKTEKRIRRDIYDETESGEVC